jgi:hypothetical protein
VEKHVIELKMEQNQGASLHRTTKTKEEVRSDSGDAENWGRRPGWQISAWEKKFLRAARVSGTEKMPGGAVLVTGGKIQSGVLCSEQENWPRLWPRAGEKPGKWIQPKNKQKNWIFGQQWWVLENDTRGATRGGGDQIDSGFDKKHSWSGSNKHKHKTKWGWNS